ncbi:hypothetical protein Hanom_Chr05g00442751 [Helianthus anomalus]
MLPSSHSIFLNILSSWSSSPSSGFPTTHGSSWVLNTTQQKCTISRKTARKTPRKPRSRSQKEANNTKASTIHSTFFSLDQNQYSFC